MNIQIKIWCIPVKYGNQKLNCTQSICLTAQVVACFDRKDQESPSQETSDFVSSTQVVAAALQLLPSLEESPAGVEGLRIFLLLTELLHVTQRFGNFEEYTELAHQTAAAIQRLSDGDMQVIGMAGGNTYAFEIICFIYLLWNCL